MAYDQEAGTSGIRKEVVDAAIKQLLKRMYKLKQLCNISPTTAWKNTFFRESSTILDSLATTGGEPIDAEGIPRLANFPEAVQTYEEVSAYIRKYGLEQTIAWEDELTDEIDAVSRCAYKLAEGVMKKVDDRIWHTISDGIAGTLGGAQSLTPSTTGVNVINIGSSFRYWENSSAQIVDNLLNASQLISEDGYDVSDLVCVVSPRDKRSIGNYIAEKGSQWVSQGSEMLLNGEVTRIAGIRIVESISVTASYAVVLKPQISCTWKEVVPLTTEMEEKKLISKTFRVAELGVPQLTDPASMCIITGTQAHT